MSGLFEVAEVALHTWGRWERQPQFWAPLRSCGMYAILPMQRERGDPVDVHLDPQSARIHRAVLGMDELHAAVLWATYVRLRSWPQVESVFGPLGIDADRFADLLRDATVTAWVRAQESEMA